MAEYQILIAHPNGEAAGRLAQQLELRGYRTHCEASLGQALERSSVNRIDAVVTTLQLPGGTGIELCERLRAQRSELALLCTGKVDSFGAVVAAIRAGADDFLAEPVDFDELGLALERALLRRSPDAPGAPASNTLPGIIGESAAMQDVYETVRRVAGLDATVLITGETGTGKELVARALHQLGKQHSSPFVAINCAAIPEGLLESELFGHKRGSFTDASSSRVGLLAMAGSGTVFLDEIGDVGLGVQVKLLRALEERRFRPLGGESELPFSGRLVVATHVDLEAQVGMGRFREDLYYRINVIELTLPPLRARGRDVLLLAHHFIRAAAAQMNRPPPGITDTALSRLLYYPWPGNVRELKNCMTYAVAHAQGNEIHGEDLTRRVAQHFATPALVAGATTEFVTLDELEQRYIRRVLDAMGGNKTLATRVLGIDRKTLYRKLEALGPTGTGRKRSGEFPASNAAGSQPPLPDTGSEDVPPRRQP